MSSNRRGSGSAKERLQAQAGEARDDVVALGSLAKKAATETLRDVRDGAADLLENGQEKLGDLGRAMRQRIHDEPVKAMLLAAGVGLVLGVIWRFRSRT